MQKEVQQELAPVQGPYLVVAQLGSQVEQKAANNRSSFHDCCKEQRITI